LAYYKVTYDAFYSKYLEVDWTDIDLSIKAGSEVEGVNEEDFEEEVGDGYQGEAPPASERRYSFPWLFYEEIFLLSEEGI